MTTEKSFQGRAVFLLGSGASVPAGMPTTQEITERVLSGESVWRHTNNLYFFDNCGQCTGNDGLVKTVVRFVNRLAKESDAYFDERASRKPTYEDLFYMASVMQDSLNGSHLNALLQYALPLLDDVRRQSLDDRFHLIEPSEWTTEGLLGEIANYIRDVTWQLLGLTPERLDHLDFLGNAMRDTQVTAVDVFTLNHDIVIEHWLRKQSIRYDDGFGEPDGDFCPWLQSYTHLDRAPVRLYKLHGSIDWFFLAPHDPTTHGDVTICRLSNRREHVCYNKKGLPYILEGNLRPLFLLGTTNKPMNYRNSIFDALHTGFHQVLYEVHCITICGYGFGDLGINNAIVEWMLRDQGNLMVVIHPDLECLIERSAQLVRPWLNDWKKDGRIRVMPCLIEKVEWSNLKSLLIR